MVGANNIAYEYIRSRIIDGEFRPAQRLVESTLAEEIGVSRNTLRKALQKLENDKLVVIEENKGATVAALDMDEIQQYYEIRTVLEELVVRASANIIGDAELQELSEVLEQMRKFSAEGQYDEYSRCNLLFHSIIYKASGKQIAVDMICNIKIQLRRFQYKTMLVPGRAENSLREHSELFEALRNHDEERAAKAILIHMNHVVKTIQKYKVLFY